MLAVLPFPDVSPEIFTISIGGFDFALRWYALAYIAGILIGWRILVILARRPSLWGSAASPYSPVQAEEFLTWAILGIVLGGRLGFVFFYQPAHYLANPGDILRVWEGGMSFHGGAMGMVLAVAIFARLRGIQVSALSDAMAVATPAGLFLGRVANFINAELWGRPSDLPWAVVFPGAAAQDCPGVVPPCARHPTQLYEAGLEGIVLGVVLLVLVFRGDSLRRPWLTTGVFFAGYGLARMYVELFRQADAQFITPDNPLGLVLRLGDFGLSMGQLLSLPMVLGGAALVLWARRR